MSEIGEVEVVVTTADVQHWHPGWVRAAMAEQANSHHDWLMYELARAIQKTVDEFWSQHEAELTCKPDVMVR